MRPGVSPKPAALGVKVPRMRRRTLMMPMQFGPTTRMPVRCVSALICCCHCAPWPPTSAKPELSTTAPPTPLAAQSSSAASTAGAGTATMARSTGPGTAATVANEGRPWICAAFGLIGYSGPS